MSRRLSKTDTRAVDPLWNNGEWRADAWFLKDPAGLRARRGRYVHSKLVELADILETVFPPGVCRQLAMRQHGGGHIGGLFFGMWGHVVPLLEMAEVIQLAGDAPERIVHRLRIPEQSLGAQLELELLAAARLSDIRADHEPLGDAGPDLRLLWDFREYFLEAKFLEPSVIATRARDIEKELEHILISVVREQAIALRLDTGDGSPLRLDRRGRDLIERVGEQARNVCRDIAAGRLGAGVVCADGVGALHIDMPPGNWASVNIFESDDGEYDSERAVRTIRNAAVQMPARGRRIVVVELSKHADVDDAVRLFEARARTRGPYYSNVDLVAFRLGHTGRGRLVAVPGEVITSADNELMRLVNQPMPPGRFAATSAISI